MQIIPETTLILLKPPAPQQDTLTYTVHSVSVSKGNQASIELFTGDLSLRCCSLLSTGKPRLCNAMKDSRGEDFGDPDLKKDTLK